MYRIIEGDEDVETLRRDMSRMDQWANRLSLFFNDDKCKVMHIGRNNAGENYRLGGELLSSTNLEKDLVLISSKLKVEQHVSGIVAKANSRLGIIGRNLAFLDKEIMMALYLVLVRPLLEYAVQCWSPFLVKDVDNIEKVQHRATKMIKEVVCL